MVVFCDLSIFGFEFYVSSYRVPEMQEVKDSRLGAVLNITTIFVRNTIGNPSSSFR